MKRIVKLEEPSELINKRNILKMRWGILKHMEETQRMQSRTIGLNFISNKYCSKVVQYI